MLDNLGDRMKDYEAAAGSVLPARMPMLLRIDGRAFHTYTQGFDKPWDDTIRDAFTAVGSALLQEVSGAKIAYCQSDELTLLATDYDSLQTQPWFGKKCAKINSVAASIATAVFNDVMRGGRYPLTKRLATFDCRCFVLPKEDVCNAFLWRQRDAERNSILGWSMAQFGKKAIHGLKCDQLRDKLEKNGTPWEQLETWKKRGWCVRRWDVPQATSAGELGEMRHSYGPDGETPIFSKDRDYIERHVFLGE